MLRSCLAAWRVVAVVAVVSGLFVLTPPAARAADLAPGSGAILTTDMVLRAEPSYDAAGLGDYGVGQWVAVGDLVYGADGSAWYAVDGGFLPAGALASDSSDTATYAQEVPADTGDQAVANDGGDQGGGGDQALASDGSGQGDAAPVEEQAPVDSQAVTDGSGTTDGAATDPSQDQTWTDPAQTDATAGAAPDPAAAEPAPADVPADQQGGGDSGAPGAVVATAWIAGTNGDGASCRTAPDFNAGDIGVLPEGSAVDVTGDAQGEWQPVNCFGTAGFVHASLIAWQAPADPGTANGDSGTVTDSAAGGSNGSSAPVADAAPPADTTSQAQNCGKRGNKKCDDGSGSGTNDGGGQAIVDYAMQYVGYPYVYAGAGPDAFDCSGFTEWVIQHTLGTDITHDMFTQVQMGSEVSRNSLQPGDLVFFQNTFRPGLSHVAIYIGNGQIVHAENESTGVVVSDLNSDYYSSRYYDARRLW